MAAYLKLACATVFVCLNYSSSFRADSFKEFDRQEGETAKKWHATVLN